MLAIGSENCFGIAKRSVLFAPGFGLMMHLCKAQIYVDRANPVKSRKALLEGAYRAKRDNVMSKPCQVESHVLLTK